MTTVLTNNLSTHAQQRTLLSIEPKSCRIWVNKDGQILDCCEHTQETFGYPYADLKSRHISTLIPSLANIKLIDKDIINPQLSYRCHCGIIPFKMVHLGGREGLFNLFINRVTLPSGPALGLICAPLS